MGPTTGTTPTAVGRTLPLRLDYLDGIRALAALFVLLHHSWLAVYPGYPHNDGPMWLGWMLYGHMAVSVFIVVSGFSLSIAPARRDLHLPVTNGQFIARRGWRILPTYWAALAFSCVVFGIVTAEQTGSVVTAKAIVVHSLMLQDVVDSTKPNGVFWSIAVEWQIYFLFPVMLLLGRRYGMSRSFAGTAALVVVGYLLAVNLSPFARFLNITPQYIVLFGMGVLAATLLRRDNGFRHAHLLVPGAALLGLGFVALCLWLGSAWVVDHFFWVDLLVGAAVASFVGALAVGRARGCAGVLGGRPLVAIGAFSYSIYLIHAPILWLVWHYLVSPLGLSPLRTLALLLALATPIVLATCWLFYLVFERPFLTRRSWAAWRELLPSRSGTRTPLPAPPVRVPDADLGR